MSKTMKISAIKHPLLITQIQLESFMTDISSGANLVIIINKII